MRGRVFHLEDPLPTLTYPHWRDVPAHTRRWTNFSAAEIACRGTGAIKITTQAMDKLQALRGRAGFWGSGIIPGRASCTSTSGLPGPYTSSRNCRPPPS